MDDSFRSFFTHYAERYLAGDAQTVADLCDLPFIAVRGGSRIDLVDRAALVAHFRELMEGYQAAGASAAAIAGIDALAQGDSAAVVTVRWQVRSAAGEVIKDFRTSYQLLGPNPWRIVSYVNHDSVRASTG